MSGTRRKSSTRWVNSAAYQKYKFHDKTDNNQSTDVNVVILKPLYRNK